MGGIPAAPPSSRRTLALRTRAADAMPVPAACAKGETTVTIRGGARWLLILILVLLTGCGATTDGDPAPTDPTPIVRAGIGVDGVAFVGDPGSAVRALPYDDVVPLTAVDAATYVFFDADGAPSRGVRVCDRTDRVQAVLLYDRPENADFETLEGVTLALSQAQVEAVLGVPFADGVNAAEGWFRMSYEGPYVNSGISFVYDEVDRSTMLFLEVFGSSCP